MNSAPALADFVERAPVLLDLFINMSSSLHMRSRCRRHCTCATAPRRPMFAAIGRAIKLQKPVPSLSDSGHCQAAPGETCDALCCESDCWNPRWPGLEEGMTLSWHILIAPP